MKTVPTKRTLAGSVGAGMGSLFAPGGKTYYILEHKVTSKYHKAGESQQIIVDHIELGRDAKCAVRYDEFFSTVSRRHAAIVRDGEMWKLVQISTTNSTFLNGRAVKTEWYLQNGDEIQLSVGGPKLGFIVPTGKNATVGSIGLTRRLSLFRDQALRPYKRAIILLTCFLLLSLVGLGYWGYSKSNAYEGLLADAGAEIEKLQSQNAELAEMVANAAEERARLDSLIKVKSRPVQRVVQQDASGLERYESDIFMIRAFLCVNYNGERIPLETANGGYLSWTGTGFLLNDGRFVTAKHCVESWKFEDVDEHKETFDHLKDDTHRNLYLAGLTGSYGVTFTTLIIAQSPSKELRFTSDQFTCNRRDEQREAIGEGLYITQHVSARSDWAYARTSQRGAIVADESRSANLPAGARLEVLGYPRGITSENSSCLYGSCQTSGRGLNDGIILISGKNFESGNSGGPVFYNDNGTFKAVGIVSFEAYKTLGGVIPLSNLR